MRQLKKWTDEYPGWLKTTQRQRRRTNKIRKDKGVGDFEKAEAILYQQFLEWRRLKYQVPLDWFSRRMIKIMEQRAKAGLEPGYDPVTKIKGTTKYTFGKSWAISGC